VLRQVGPITGLEPARPGEKPNARPDGSFGNVLARETARVEDRSAGEMAPAQDVRLSAHARERLESRHITLTDQHQARLDEAVARAGEKGANQSLVLLDDLALVVSVRNRVVITALDEEKAKSGVFTNIDSAVIA
jgi:flagellar operon protein